MNIVTLKIGDIKPYWRNPRHNNDESVNAVMDSIKEYGYQSPIIVDEDNVIIVGDTRYKALMRLGYEEISVIKSDMDEKKATGYRIIDNKASEKASWDWEKLIPELRTMQNLDKFQAHFPELKLNPINVEIGKIDEDAIKLRQEQLTNQFTNSSNAVQSNEKTQLCPHCGEEFQIL